MINEYFIDCYTVFSDLTYYEYIYIDYYKCILVNYNNNGVKMLFTESKVFVKDNLENKIHLQSKQKRNESFWGEISYNQNMVKISNENASYLYRYESILDDICSGDASGPLKMDNLILKHMNITSDTNYTIYNL